MLIWKKVISEALAFLLLGYFNFCLVECAFAFSNYSDCATVESSPGHHHENSDHHEPASAPGKHDAVSQCCSSLNATEAFQTFLFSSLIVLIHDFYVDALERTVKLAGPRLKYEIEYLPGTSPPAVFLLNHFTHAPPVFP